MDANLEISLDKLPIKRLEAIEENGTERFPSDVDYDEKTLSLVRRIDFAWAVERDEEKKKKQKKSSEESSSSAKPWPWQSMVENLKLAHQELSVIIDLINTVEANDAVTVASMTRPKPLPNEVMSDLAVSAATKLQCFRHLGKYFKQSAKALEQQVAKEARFYGALIRLQQNWKVKKQRVAASAFGNEGFTFDLFDNLLYDSASVVRPSTLSTVRIDHDSAGMLALNLPPNSCQALHFGFLGANLDNGSKESSKMSSYLSKEGESDTVNDDECIKQAHSLLRDVHQAIFSEQVFDFVTREAFNPSAGYNVTGMRENFLQLSLGQEISVYLSLAPLRQDDQTSESESPQDANTSLVPLDSFNDMSDGKDGRLQKLGFPNQISYEIYLLQIIHEHVFLKDKDRPLSATSGISGQSRKDGPGLLSHFCLSLAHRIFSNKVLLELEKVVCGVPYLHLISHPTWHCRTSSWTVFMEVPQSILHIDSHSNEMSNSNGSKNIRSQFRTKVVVTDDCINVEGDGTPNVVGLFKGSSENTSSMNRYDCHLADLPVIILQQVASQIIRWLHEEALMVGIKSTRDHLCLSFELEQGETLSLVAHVDSEDPEGCISWWLIIEDGSLEEHQLLMDVSGGSSEYRKFLGHLSLDVLYSTLMDLVSLCNGGGSV